MKSELEKLSKSVVKFLKNYEEEYIGTGKVRIWIWI